MRLIDADALIEVIIEKYCLPCREMKADCDGVICKVCLIGGIADDVRKTPTIEPSGDFISKADAIKGKFWAQQTNGVEIEDVEVVPVGYIKALPSATVPPDEEAYERGYDDGIKVARKEEETNKTISSDLISRSELFNKLAEVRTPIEANEYKADVYKIIQSM